MTKIIHISDLHLGKRMNEFSLISDQKYILDEILDIINKEQPSALLICGDIYDKKTPSEEAVTLFDGFLNKLSELNLQTFIISGNHDSADRMAFGRHFMEKSRIYISGGAENIKGIPLDSDPNVVIYGLPFVTPANIRSVYPEAQIGSYTDAVREAISHIDIDASKTNILLSHQFVTQGCQSDNDITVGTLENVDCSVFKAFDYVALGHIHRPYFADTEKKIRYCGSPLKYSRSEIDNRKSLSIIEIEGKSIGLREVPLLPLHDVQELKGKFETLMSRDYYSGIDTDNYYFVVLTDEEFIADVPSKIRTVYPNILSVEYRNTKTAAAEHAVLPTVSNASPFEQFAKFFSIRSGGELTEEQAEYARQLFEELEKEDENGI